MEWLKRAGIALGALVGVLVLWGFLAPHLRLQVEREEVEVPDLPPGWEGARVAVIADIHVGMPLGNPGIARKAIETLVREKPDLVLIAGDFVVGATGEAETIRKAAAMVEPLRRSGLRVYAVLGNHDYSLAWKSESPHLEEARALEAAVEGVGIPVLENEAVAVPPPGGRGDPLYVVGLGSAWAHRDDPGRALSGLPAGAPRLVFMHNPSSFRKIAAGAAPLAVAGHTHGGDVRVPFSPHWSWLDWVQGEKLPADAWAKPGFGARGNRLYVNRGIGNSTLPFRLNDPPEVTIFKLRRSPPR